MKISIPAFIKTDPSWSAFLAFAFLVNISMPLARIALLCCLFLSIANRNRRKAFQVSAPFFGWLFYLVVALAITGLIVACSQDVENLLSQFAAVKPRRLPFVPQWRLDMMEAIRESGVTSSGGIWDYLPDAFIGPFRRAGTDMYTDPVSGLRKITKLLWYVAIPVALLQVDSRPRLLKSLRAFLYGGVLMALSVIIVNPIGAAFQMLFPTAYEVEAGTASPFSTFLYRVVDQFGSLENVNKWIYTRGRAETFSLALIKLGTMQAAQRLMTSVPVAICLLFESIAVRKRLLLKSRRSILRDGIILLIVLIGLLLTCKRGPVIAAAVVSGFLLLLRLRLRYAILLLLAVFAIGASIPQVRTRFVELPSEFELRRGGRAMMWTCIVPKLHEEYPMGIGFRALTYNKMRAIDNHIEQNQNHVHSVPLQAFVEFGYLGVFAYLLWMGLTFYATGRLALRSRRKINSSLPETMAFAAPLAMFSTLFLYGLVEYNLADSEIVLLYAFAMGLTNRNLLHSVPAIPLPPPTDPAK